MEAETRFANRWTLRMVAAAACLTVAGVTTFAQSPAPAQPSPNQAPHAWRKADNSGTPNNSSQAVDNNNQPAPAENAGPAPQDAQAQAAPQDAQPAAPPAEAWPAQDPAAAGQQPPPPPPNAYPPQQQQPYPPQAQQPYPPQAQQSYPPNAYGNNYSIPATLTITPGTYITVRVNGWLSSDKNQPGDAFTGTLAEPVIVNGVVIAQRGQTVGGVVTEAKKAGRVEGTSTLGVRLTDLTTVDGQKLNLQTAMVGRSGDTSVGRDAAAIGGTTALGAAVGAAADWGRGAAIGAGAGAAAGIIGVLLTRGHPTVIYPETALTFRVEAPVTIDTTHASQAFRYADQSDYGAPAYAGPPPARMGAPGPGYGYGAAPYAPAPYYGPGYYPYYYPYPYYWGGLSFYVGPRFYYPHYYAGGIWIRRR